MNELLKLSLCDLNEKLSSREVSSYDATRACLERIAACADLNAYLHVDEEGALQQARQSDERRNAGKALGVLEGVPLALKDIFLTRDLPTTCASKILENFIAPYDAHVVTKLRGQGAVLLGKLNMDAFAMGSSNEHSAFGPTKNPWNPERVPGGSSGGSAAAVAGQTAFGSLGTDTGGSIRQPAAHCGIVGLKPSYGRVSRYGVIAFASSLDQVGPMGKDVRDCAHLLQAIAGHDPNDATSAMEPVPDYTASLEDGVKGLRIGIPRQYFAEGIDPAVLKAVEEAIETYRSLGAQIVDVDLPHTDYAIATYYLICTAEASSNLARYDGVRYGIRRGDEDGLLSMYEQTRAEGFGPEVQRRILLGTYILSAGYYDAYYLKAQKVRTLIRQDFASAFEKADALLTPTTPSTAFRLGENTTDPIKMYLSDIFTVGCNLAGLAGLSMPCGFDAEGLPIGCQLLAAPFQESTLLRIARAYEREHIWSQRRPTL